MTDLLPVTEAPFPGALSQVPGHRAVSAAESARDLPLPHLSESTPSTRRTGRTLPLGHTISASGAGDRVICLPVRAEHVSVAKTVAVYEQMKVRRTSHQHPARVDATARTEVLRVEEASDLEKTRALIRRPDLTVSRASSHQLQLVRAYVDDTSHLPAIP